MGEVDLNKVEVTLLSLGKTRVKRINGEYADALIFAKHARVTLSDGTQVFVELRLVPGEIYQSGTEDADQFVYEHVFIEGYDVFNDPNSGGVVHEKRGHI